MDQNRRLDWLEEQLFSRRLVLLSGQVDAAAANRVAAQLMVLAAHSDEPIDLHVSAADAELTAGLALIDALELVSAPVRVLVTGQLGGAALGVLCAAAERATYAHATFRLSEPRQALPDGTAHDIAEQVANHHHLLLDLQDRLAAVTGQPIMDIAGDMARGRFLTAAEAVDYGLVERIRRDPR